MLIIMTKVWQKDYDVNKEIEKFTVGKDHILDKTLLKYYIIETIAHASMLKKIRILKEDEFTKLKKELKDILGDKNFDIKQSDEDVHTAVENYLTKKLGNLGKKIHTARSRNDQSNVDMRLYIKEKLFEIIDSLLKLAKTLLDFSQQNKNTPMPGYTHTQKAMPSSAALWSGAFLESLLDDLILLKTAFKLNNQCPLGSAASYGVPLNIDRKYVSDLLGFEKPQNNVLYAQNSRGKIESIVLSALTQIMIDLGKLSTDLILFSTPEFGYFELPKEFCTGSSIMPQKKNPDVLELARAKVSVVESCLFEVNGIIKNIISGYNRDFQLTKEPLMKGAEVTNDTIKIIDLVIKGMKVNKTNCIKACTPEIFATDKALELVKKGIPFRDAYKEVGLNLNKLKSIDPVKNIMEKKHIGATGNLGLEKAKSKIDEEIKELSKEKNKFDDKMTSSVG